MANPIYNVDGTVEYVGEPSFYLHRVGKDGWRKSVYMVSAKHLPNTLWALRHSEHEQWFIVRDVDGVVVAQSKNCQWTARG